MSPVKQILSWPQAGPGKMPFQLSQHGSGSFWILETVSILYFYFSLQLSPWATVSDCSHFLHGDSWSGFWIQGKPATSADGEIWNKRSGRELLVPKCYPIVRASWCRELKLSWVSAVTNSTIENFLTFGLWSHLGHPKFVHSYISEILEKRDWTRNFGTWAFRWNFRSKRNFLCYNFEINGGLGGRD